MSNINESETSSLIEKDEKPTKKFSFKINTKQLLWLLILAKQEWILVLIGSFFLLTGSATSLVLPNFVGQLIDQILTSAQGKVIIFKINHRIG